MPGEYLKEKMVQWGLAGCPGEFKDWLPTDAKHRIAEGQRKGGRTAGRGRPKLQRKESSTPDPESSYPRHARETAAILAKAGGASRTYLYAARRVRRSAPDLLELIAKGELKIYKAEKIARRREELMAVYLVEAENGDPEAWQKIEVILDERLAAFEKLLARAFTGEDRETAPGE